MTPSSPCVLPPLTFTPTTPLSALDPFLPVLSEPAQLPSPSMRPTMTRSVSESSSSTSQRSSTHGDFFQAVILDSPMRDPTCVGGSTKPLRVQKKKKDVTMGESIRQGRPRQSEMSLPRSPRSPTFHPSSSHAVTDVTVERNPSNASTTVSAAHRSISQLMLNLPITPLPEMPARPLTPPDSDEEKRSPSIQSNMHLGLGRFGPYDHAVIPGQSPPESPTPGSEHRLFLSALDSLPQGAGARHAWSTPDSPITPSRAPPKAAALLGAVEDTGRAKSSKQKKSSKKHFRPLPGSTMAEIERFFGDVPSKNGKHAGAAAARQNPSVPSRHVDVEGRLWLDVEEEQEFAWLMSQPVNPPRPSVDTLRPPPKLASYLGTDGLEDAWGMQRFTSVLDMDGRAPARRQPPKVKLGGRSKKDKRHDESFLDLGMKTAKPKRSKGPETVVVGDNNDYPWGAAAIVRPLQPRTELNVGDTVIVPPPRTTSRSCSQAESPRPAPPPLIRKITPPSPSSRPRPPPLTLSAAPPRKNLPILTPNTPEGPAKLSVAASNRARSDPPSKGDVTVRPGAEQAPHAVKRKPVKVDLLIPSPEQNLTRTPFAHPRKAPVPQDSARPPLPISHSRTPSSQSSTRKVSLDICDLEPITYPAHLATMHPPLVAASPGGGPARPITRPPPLVLPAMPDDPPVSYFEPVTPVAAKPPTVTPPGSVSSTVSEKAAAAGKWLKAIKKTRVRAAA